MEFHPVTGSFTGYPVKLPTAGSSTHACDPDRMRAVVQRVLSASVTVDGSVSGRIDGPGLLAYVGVTHSDGDAEVAWLARKLWELRLLRD